MKINVAVYFVLSLTHGLCFCSSTPRFWHPRLSSDIVQEKLLPQVLFERSLREKKRNNNHSGKKRGIFLINDREKLVFPGQYVLPKI